VDFNYIKFRRLWRKPLQSTDQGLKDMLKDQHRFAHGQIPVKATTQRRNL